MMALTSLARSAPNRAARTLKVARSRKRLRAISGGANGRSFFLWTASKDGEVRLSVSWLAESILWEHIITVVFHVLRRALRKCRQWTWEVGATTLVVSHSVGHVEHRTASGNAFLQRVPACSSWYDRLWALQSQDPHTIFGVTRVIIIFGRVPGRLRLILRGAAEELDMSKALPRCDG